MEPKRKQQASRPGTASFISKRRRTAKIQRRAIARHNEIVRAEKQLREFDTAVALGERYGVKWEWDGVRQAVKDERPKRLMGSIQDQFTDMQMLTGFYDELEDDETDVNAERGLPLLQTPITDEMRRATEGMPKSKRLSALQLEYHIGPLIFK